MRNVCKCIFNETATSSARLVYFDIFPHLSALEPHSSSWMIQNILSFITTSFFQFNEDKIIRTFHAHSYPQMVLSE